MMLAWAIAIEAICLTGATIDDCGVYQMVKKNDFWIGKGIVTKKSMVKHLEPHTTEQIYVVPDKVWLSFWTGSNRIWEKNITYVKPHDGEQSTETCRAGRFEFVTKYNFNSTPKD